MTTEFPDKFSEMMKAFDQLEDIVKSDLGLKEKLKALYSQYKKTRDTLPWYKILLILAVAPFAESGIVLPLLGVVLAFGVLPLIIL